MITFIACAAALSAALPMRAAPGAWTPIGPPGGGVAVYTSPADPQRLWALGSGGYASSGGVYASSDGGQSWQLRSTGLPLALGGAVLALDAHDPDTAYTGFYDGEVFKTFDAGGHWGRLVINVDPGFLHALAVDPFRSQTVYLGSDRGAFKSADGGATWTAINVGLPRRAAVEGLGLDPLNAGTIYAEIFATQCSVAKSVDGGDHWSVIGSACFTQFVFHPRLAGVLFAYDGNLWRTNDGGQTWTTLRQIGRGLEGVGCPGFAIDRSQPRLMYAVCSDGLYRSTSSGRVWSRVKSLAAAPLVSVSSTSDGNAVWAGSGGSCLDSCGPFRSTDFGSTWTISAGGLVAGSATAVLIDRANPSHVLQGIEGYGVASSSDGGATWRGSTGFAFQPEHLSAVHIDSLDQSAGPAPVFVARALYLSHSGPTFLLFRSTDGGLTWTSFAPATVAFAFHPTNPQRAVTGMAGSFFYSDDGGATWKPASGEVANTLGNDLRFSPARPDDAYAVGLVALGPSSFQHAIWKSIDGGLSWHRIAQSLADAGVAFIFPDPTSPDVAYAADRSANLWSSADGGLTWTALTGAAGLGISSLVLTPTHPTTLLGLSARLGVVLSLDGGGHFTPANAGLPHWDVRGISPDPRDPQHLYAAVNGGGIEELTLPAASGCDASATALCLTANRFKVEVAWRDFQGNTGAGQAVPFTSDSGYFWFFDAANVELVVKILDKRDLNNAFWVFYGAMSTVEYHITITDTATGLVRTYSNPSGHLASFADTNAFPGP
ncbi:MAG TPA: hypothetical protein VHR45_08415 [Thermoanaerobaculia bacterium]|nr:hypothetical protein [Thermoanaerobaculia bacterium]